MIPGQNLIANLLFFINIAMFLVKRLYGRYYSVVISKCDVSKRDCDLV